MADPALEGILARLRRGVALAEASPGA